MQQRIVSITVIVAVVGGLFALFAYNSMNNKTDMTAWNENMTMGDAETAKHHYVMYTDIFCPYCDKFSDAVAAHDEEFKRNYIDGQNILFEMRITDMNYESGHSNNSRPAGIATYCAANQGKFWEYYHGILNKIFEDYHSKNIGVDRTSEKIPDLETDYFLKIAKDIDFDQDKFKSCVENEETAQELDDNTKRASGIVGGGVPYFQFDKFVTSGFLGYFDTEKDWVQAKSLLDAGLTTK